MKESSLITLAVIGGLAVAGYFIYQHYKTTTPAAQTGISAPPTVGQQVGSTIDTAGTLAGDIYGLYNEFSGSGSGTDNSQG